MGADEERPHDIQGDVEALRRLHPALQGNGDRGAGEAGERIVRELEDGRVVNVTVVKAEQLGGCPSECARVAAKEKKSHLICRLCRVLIVLESTERTRKEPSP